MALRDTPTVVRLCRSAEGPGWRKTGQPGREEHGIQGHDQAEVSPDAPHGGLTQIDGGDEAVKTAFRQHHVRHFPGQIRAVAQGHPHVGGGQRRKVVDPSPSMATVWPSA